MIRCKCTSHSIILDAQNAGCGASALELILCLHTDEMKLGQVAARSIRSCLHGIHAIFSHHDVYRVRRTVMRMLLPKSCRPRRPGLQVFGAVLVALRSSCKRAFALSSKYRLHLQSAWSQAACSCARHRDPWRWQPPCCCWWLLAARLALTPSGIGRPAALRQRHRVSRGEQHLVRCTATVPAIPACSAFDQCCATEMYSVIGWAWLQPDELCACCKRRPGARTAA